MTKEHWPSRAEVLERLFAAWTPKLKKEEVTTEAAIGRITAEDLFAVHSLPVVRASAMDGIGVTASSFKDGYPDTKLWRPCCEYVRADTGDDFDDRYDAVIPIEDVTILEDGGLRLSEGIRVEPGMNIRPMGSYIAKGELLVRSGTKLTPSDLAALVMGGIERLWVMKKPVAAFIPTGSELVRAGSRPERGQNIDSNSILVKHMLLEMGAAPVIYPVVRDDREELERALMEGLSQADVVIINGGSSKGGEDFNAELLKQKGQVLCHNVAAAPGRPMCVAVIGGKPVINLPGPSIACYYGMDWCVGAVIGRMFERSIPRRRTVTVRLAEDICYHKGMEILCKMEIWNKGQGYEARQVPFRASSILENLTAPGYFVTDPGKDCHKAGELLEVELLREEEP